MTKKNPLVSRLTPKQKKIESDLRRLVTDPLNTTHPDRDFQDFVVGQFDKTFGTHPPKRDDTGKQIDAAPHERELDPFKRTIRKEDIDLEDSVGLGRKNKFRDVFGIQKALSNTGDFVLDMSRERGGELTIGLATAIEDFQRRNGLKVDGIVNPAGPTATRVGTILFGASDSDNQRLLRADHDKESSREVSQNGRAF